VPEFQQNRVRTNKRAVADVEKQVYAHERFLLILGNRTGVGTRLLACERTPATYSTYIREAFMT
jgi:hypothetical protein